MNILIDNKNGEPLYNQIYCQVKKHMISGDVEDVDICGSALLQPNARMKNSKKKASFTHFRQRDVTLRRKT